MMAPLWMVGGSSSREGKLIFSPVVVLFEIFLMPAKGLGPNEPKVGAVRISDSDVADRD